jgi:tetraacyldisaccharide 4'-kinase
MMPPAFWARDGVLPRLLAPVAAAVAAATARRVARPGWRAPVPVLCCGNAGLGGAGKTTVVLDLARRLRARGLDAHCLTRGYGGRARGVLRVDPERQDSTLVGDEPLLLSETAPTWVGADRAAAARAAVAAGAEVLLMDDGLQNPGLAKTASLLVIDGAAGFGNGRVVPAGPLREPAQAAASRCRAGVLIGADVSGARAAVPRLMLLEARLEPDRRLDGVRAFAFSGIARPGKFHATLRAAGAELTGAEAFGDHHRFSDADLARVLARADALGARPVTTPKDAVRLPAALRPAIEVLGVRLAWCDEAALDRLLDEVLH